MDEARFDRWTRTLGAIRSRRWVLTAVVGGAIATLLRPSGEAGARPGTVALGGACYHVRQCNQSSLIPRHSGLDPSLQWVYCSDNGFTYDGKFNCCRRRGGFCRIDEHCCAARKCRRNFCV